MRVTNGLFTRAQDVHLNVLKKILEEKKVSNPATFDDQIEDIYSFLLHKGQNILSRQNVKLSLKTTFGTTMAAYELIDLTTKHMSFCEFLRRVANLQMFKVFMNEAEKYSELLVKFMFRVLEKQTQKNALEELKKDGKLARYGIGDDSGESPEALEDVGGEIGEALDAAVSDMSDFGEAAPLLSDMLEGLDQDPDECPAGKGKGTLKSVDVWEDRITYLTDNFDIRSTVIYDLAHTLDLAIEAKHNSNEYERTSSPEEFKNIDVEQGKDVTKATPIDQMKDDAEFFDKMAKGELNQRVYEEAKSKKQCLYVLCDVSGSMSGKRSNIASALVMSLCRKTAKLDDGIFFLRFFDGGVFDRQDVLTRGMAKKMEQYVLQQGFSGGGTDIQGALDVAIKDISKAESEFGNQLRKAEILLITDAEDSSVSKATKARLDQLHIKLHSFLVGIGHGGNALREISDTFKYVEVTKQGAMSVVDSLT